MSSVNLMRGNNINYQGLPLCILCFREKKEREKS